MTNEEAKKAGFRIDANGWATTWRILNTSEIRRLNSMVRGLDANDFPTREKARDALRKQKADAKHAKWLSEMQSQTTPITPEQAKMLRPDDMKYGYDTATLGVFGIRGDAKEEPIYAKTPLFFTEQAARNRLNEVIAAQAARDKAKAEAEPLEWCEYNEGYRLSPEAFISFDDGKTWTTVTGKFIGVCYSERLGIRARYRNPLWLAKHGKSVESRETPVGETQAKEVVTGETQPKALCNVVSHPSHYTSHPSGVECITITKHMNFCRGNAMKYLWRAGQKGDSIDKEIEDIAKAEEYCRIEKERLIALKGAK